MPSVARLLQAEWLDMLAQEGTVEGVQMVAPLALGDGPEGEPPCPACGTAAPLVAGECSECGLFLGA